MIEIYLHQEIRLYIYNFWDGRYCVKHPDINSVIEIEQWCQSNIKKYQWLKNWKIVDKPRYNIEIKMKKYRSNAGMPEFIIKFHNIKDVALFKLFFPGATML
jgi:hypothetical protein